MDTTHVPWRFCRSCMSVVTALLSRNMRISDLSRCTTNAPKEARTSVARSSRVGRLSQGECDVEDVVRACNTIDGYRGTAWCCELDCCNRATSSRQSTSKSGLSAACEPDSHRRRREARHRADQGALRKLAKNGDLFTGGC